ncbi:MAG: hypothetical protein N2205_01050, partial [Candidatus Caldatribacterium sp.]|nr:hypothetical protein [Candidatus Caldatribacterium sp.]
MCIRDRHHGPCSRPLGRSVQLPLCDAEPNCNADRYRDEYAKRNKYWGFYYRRWPCWEPESCGECGIGSSGEPPDRHKR